MFETCSNDIFSDANDKGHIEYCVHFESRTPGWIRSYLLIPLKVQKPN